MADLDGSGKVNLIEYMIIDTNHGAQGDWHTKKLMEMEAHMLFMCQEF